MDQQAAHAFLTQLLEDFLNYTTPYLLPADKVLAAWKDPLTEESIASLVRAIHQTRESAQASSRDAYGPLVNWRDYELPEDLQDIILRRFEPLLHATEVSS
jgi:hypothetical protein